MDAIAENISAFLDVPSSPNLTASRPFARRCSLREVWHYRELVYFFARRDIVARYQQTALGIGWTILQPLCSMLMLILCFQKIAGLAIDGLPYPLFSFAGVLLWSFFSKAVSSGSHRLIAERKLVARIYFPRLVIPLATVCAHLVDFAVGFALLIVLAWFYGAALSCSFFLFAALSVFALLCFSLGASFALGALHVLYRDVGYAITFVLQLTLYVTPVAYSLKNVPAGYRPLIILNPLTGIIECFRCALFHRALDWRVTGYALGASLVTLIGGTLFFQSRERTFADIL